MKKLAVKFTIILLFTIISVIKAQEKSGNSLSDADKVFGLSQVWSEVKYNFVYFDKIQLDWDSLYNATLPSVLKTTSTQSYYDELRRFIAHAKDGHTSVWYPSSFYRKEYVPAPVKTDLVQGKVFITGILNDTVSQNGIEPGMEILKVDGMDVHEYAAKNIRPFEGASTKQGMNFYLYSAYLLNGPIDKAVKLTLKDKNGKTRDYEIPRRLVKKQESLIQFKTIENNIGLLTITGFTASDFNKQFDELYSRILETKSLIIDLRENTGGNGAQGEYMLKHFLKTGYKDPAISSRQYNPLMKVWGFNTGSLFTIIPGTNQPFKDRTIYEKPIVLLISNKTGSAAEDFAMLFDQVKRGEMIGQLTSGSTGQPMISTLPGGGTLRICVRKDTYPDGKEFVGVGIQPTVLIEQNITSLFKGEDAVLKTAQELLIK
ncbi:MAG: S41 family peptidase [Flavitalea sp.]